MSALFQNSVEHNLDRRRRGRSELWSDAPPRMVTRHEGGTECHILLLLREIFESEYKVQLADIFNYPLLKAGDFQLNIIWLALPVALTATLICILYARHVFACHQVMG